MAVPGIAGCSPRLRQGSSLARQAGSWAGCSSGCMREAAGTAVWNRRPTFSCCGAAARGLRVRARSSAAGWWRISPPLPPPLLAAREGVAAGDRARHARQGAAAASAPRPPSSGGGGGATPPWRCPSRRPCADVADAAGAAGGNSSLGWQAPSSLPSQLTAGDLEREFGYVWRLRRPLPRLRERGGGWAGGVRRQGASARTR
ncbi:hypothetical protein Agub_g8176, partial [Astrephomene gubernaculifera]